MKLYRLSVIVGDSTRDRAVWADRMDITEQGSIIFRLENGDIIAVYPTKSTFITNIETEEQYNARKQAGMDSLKKISES